MSKADGPLLTEATRLARDYADSRSVLSDQVRDAERRIAEIKAEAIPGIRDAASKAATRKERLVRFVQEHPGFFAKPKSRTVMGVKFGLRKQVGKVRVADEQGAIDLAQKLHPDRGLVKTTRKLLLKALRELTGQELAAMGVTIADSTDAPFAEMPDTELDKLLNVYIEDPS